ncbi:MAG: hypothetical protein DLM72_15695 [Candidatus Nitrosopolaris wilkensis]|nr:MAG: hypothetical protein DLM72_15695 [Candidatus Nitrosopolaris wilkensis]
MQTICVKTKEININDPLFERKIEIATDGLSRDCFNWLRERVAKLSKENAAIISSLWRLSKSEYNVIMSWQRGHQFPEISAVECIICTTKYVYYLVF